MTASELGKFHISVVTVRVAVLVLFCGIRVAMHTPLTDHSPTADALEQTPNINTLSGSAHRERSSATCLSLLSFTLNAPDNLLYRVHAGL